MCHPLSRKHASSESVASEAYRYAFCTVDIGSGVPFPSEGRFIWGGGGWGLGAGRGGGRF